MINKIRAELLFSKGQNQTKCGQLEESIKSFDKALSFNPSYSGIYLHRALSLSKLKEYTNAVTTLMTAIGMNPSNPAYHLFLGIIHYDHRNYDEAIVAFEQTLKLCPNNYLALCYKHLTLLTTGENIDDSGNILMQHFKMVNHDFQSKLLVFCETVCFQNIDSGRPFDVFHENIKSIESSKSSTITILDSFSITLASGFYKIRYFNPIKKAAYKHYNKARRAELNGEDDIAIQEYQKAIEIFNEFHDARDNLTGLYWNKGYDVFLSFFKKLPIYDEISTLILNYKTSGEDRTRFKSDIIRYSTFIFMLAYAYYQIGDYDNSLELFEMLYKSGINDPLKLYYVACCYIAKKDPDNALTVFQLSLKNLLNQRIIHNRLEQTLKLLRHH